MLMACFQKTVQFITRQGAAELAIYTIVYFCNNYRPSLYHFVTTCESTNV